MTIVPLVHKIALSMFPGIGAVNARRLVAYLSSVSAVFEVSKKELQGIPGIGKNLINIIIEKRDLALERAQNEVKFIEKYKIKTLFYLDSDYPKRLAQCNDAPIVMFMKGGVDLNFPRIISIVGTRNATIYGKELTANLIEGLGNAGIEVLVASGLAFGIDVAAHKAALKAGCPTIGIVAHGLDKMYPPAHANIAKKMVSVNSALLTDFPSASRIDPGNFLRRNRIIAGLADCTIVVESGKKGGALITADIANSYNRDVFVFPGRIGDKYSKGCNNLIKYNKAALIENANDLIEFMGWETKQQPVQQPLFIDLDKEEQSIIDILKQNEIVATDFIARSIHLPVQKINSILLTLEFKGVIKPLPGNRVKLLVMV